ncbi:MAG: hypothetical protein ACRBFS_12890 [Aureispira sp.]
MNRNKILYATLLTLGSIGLQAQNVGIGEPTPTAKLHVNQTDNVDAVFVVQAGTGNAIEAVSTDPANGGSMLWMRNGTNGVTIDAFMTNAAATASNIVSFNDGLGAGLNIQQRNAGASGTGIFVNQNGNDPFSRGIDIFMQPTTVAYGQTIFHDGLGGGTYLDLRNTVNNIIGSYVIHRGLGVGTQIDLTNAANTSTVSFLRTAGIGRGLEVDLTNANNLENASSIFHAGDGIGEFISMTNATATNNSVGLFVQYNGSGAGAGGGGNAAEFQNYGTNGNAIDVFNGNPGLAPGPANTTNEFAVLSLSHMATGASPTANAVKAAINALNYSEDPTIVAQNSSTTIGAVIEAYLEPNIAAAALSTSIYGRADRNPTTGYGVAMWGDGGNYGVVGGTSTNANSSNFGLLSLTNSGAFGVKSFVIDHPAAPTEKTLRHFSVESNEVLNLYRGIVELDANGQGIVALPDYFDAINTNVTYQLTPIGTGVQPYVAVEEANNQFTVAGAPNTKVSWTIHAQRNDPTLRYFEQVKGAGYKSPVTAKKPHEQGKYLVPEAYGQPKEAGVFYNAAREQRAQEAHREGPRQQALEAPKRTTTPVETLQPSKIRKEGGELSNK